MGKKKGQEEIDCVSSKYTPIQRFEKTPKKSLSNARNARPILPLKNDRTSRYETNKNIAKRWCFLSKKQKRILSSPFKNKTKISLIKSNEKNKTLHYSVLVSLS